MSEQDIHDLRGEIGGMRSDIRGLRDEVRDGFSLLNGRVRKTEDALVEARARASERSDMVASGQIIQVPRPPMHRDPRTYVGGSIGTAIGSMVLEVVRVLTTAAK